MEGEGDLTPRNNLEHLKQMIAAVDAVISGSMSQREAAKAFDIPRSTLRSHLPKNLVYKSRVKNKAKLNPILSKKEEKELVTYLLSMHRAGFGRTRQDLLLRVQGMLNKAERKTEFENNMPSNDWYENFLKRHKNSIQQCTLALDLDEVGILPVDANGINRILEAAVQQAVSLSPHSDGSFHLDGSLTLHGIRHSVLDSDNLATTRASLSYQL